MSIYRKKPSIHGNTWTPYYYVVGWSHLDRWYVGVRTESNPKFCAHPDELMVTYFTSSDNHVHPFMDVNGLPDFIWTFPCKTAEEAQAGETRIMDEFAHFLADDRWINKNKAGAVVYSDEIAANISAARRGKKKSKEHIARIAESNRLTWACPERRRRHSEVMKQCLKGTIKPPRTAEHQAKINEALRDYYRRKRDN